jgi:hypothetical protein
MAHTFDAITIGLKIEGCMDSTAANYNSNASIDSGICFDAAFEDCVKNLLFSVSLKDCHSDQTKRALKIYALHEGYKQAVREGNQVKINTYTQQLTDMCNAEYCESC